MPDITLAQAKTVVEAAFAKAQALGVKMNIAVVDTGTHLKAFRPHGRRLARFGRHFDSQGPHGPAF